MSEEGRSLRLFYALWPDPRTADRLQDLQLGLGGRKTHHDDFHITVVFLGNRPPEQLPVLVDILQGLSSVDMLLQVDRFGYFARNRIAWAGMQSPPPALFDLQAQLRNKLRQADIVFHDHGEYRPHITLSRNAQAPEGRDFEPFTWQARRLVLAKSEPGAHGAKYSMVAEHEGEGIRNGSKLYDSL